MICAPHHRGRGDGVTGDEAEPRVGDELSE
jgi:hypothetical protein